MPGGQFVITTRSDGQILTGAMYNADRQEIVDHLIPIYIDDASENVTAMRQTANPGESGSENLAVTLDGEIRQLRFRILEITGGDYWYETQTGIRALPLALASLPAAGKQGRLAYETGFKQLVADSGLKWYAIERSLNIQAWGAIGDGSTNDTTAIQNVINATTTKKPYVYAPGSDYVISTTLNKTSAANFRGIVGDGPRVTNFKGTGLSAHAMEFTDIAFGSIFDGFGIEGPGQSAGGTISGLRLPATPANSDVTYQNTYRNLYIRKFPTHGLYLQVPIVSTVENVVCELIGTSAFKIDTKPTNINVGGTSTNWLNCYANNCLGKGYDFTSHVYFHMSGCAADNVNDSYFFKTCSGGNLTGCGSEVPTYINGSLPGRAVVLDTCANFTIASQWQYNPSSNVNAANVMMDLIGTRKCVITSPLVVGMNEAPAAYATTDIRLDGGCEDNIIQNAGAFGRANERAVVSNSGVTTKIEFGSVTTTDQTVRSLTTTGTTGGGIAITTTGNIQATTTSNPQLILINSGGTPRSWAVSADNSKSLVFYDITGAQAPGSFYPVDGGGNQGKLQLNYGLIIDGGTFVSNATNLTISSGGDVTADGEVSCVGVDTTADVTVTTASNPGIGFVNTSATPRSWSVSANNSKSFVFYDVTGVQSVGSFYPVDGGGNQGKLQLNYGVIIGASGAAISSHLTSTASLDFGNTSSQTSADLTITVTGAAVGDTVVLGVPNGSVNANSCYTAWVSASDTVTVRFNNYSSGAIDPGSGTFRVDVWKH